MTARRRRKFTITSWHGTTIQHKAQNVRPQSYDSRCCLSCSLSLGQMILPIPVLLFAAISASRQGVQQIMPKQHVKPHSFAEVHPQMPCAQSPPEVYPPSALYGSGGGGGGVGLAILRSPM